ncbi:hypothetical protein HK100_003414, partial [Physocladia obscura]
MALNGRHNQVAKYLEFLVQDRCIYDLESKQYFVNNSNGLWKPKGGEVLLQSQILDAHTVLDAARRYYVNNEIIIKLIDKLSKEIDKTPFQNNVIAQYQ